MAYPSTVKLGQKGHKGKTLEQVANPDYIEEHRLDRRAGKCEHCESSLRGAESTGFEKKEYFRKLLRRQLAFSGLRAIAVRTVAAYIDLNPVRAGLCENPEDYRWCSYAAAVGGEREARRGLAKAFGRQKWTAKVAADYRMILFGRGQEVIGGATPRGYVKPKRGFSRERVVSEQKRGAKLPMHAALRCRVRYFTAGAVLGSREFVNGVFEQNRDRFGPSRESGARPMRGAEWGNLTTMRDLGDAVS